MRVAMLTSSFPRGKNDYAVPFIYHLARNLVEEGVDVHVVAPTDVGAQTTEMMDGIVVHRFRYLPSAQWQRLTYRNGGIPVTLQQSWGARLQVFPFMVAFANAAWRVVKNVDVVHSHWTLAGLIGLMVARPRRLPTVLTSWGADINLAKGAFLTRLNRFLLQRTDQITAVSDDLVAQIIDLGIPSNRVQLLPNAINDKIFTPMVQAEAREKLGIQLDLPIILFVGSLIERKGIHDLVEAMPHVLNKQPNARLYVLGSGHLEHTLKQRAQILGLATHITFIAAQSAATIPLWMNAADVFVLPSYSEGRPTVILEAMACGTPVIATNIGGNQELVEPQRTGLLAKISDPEDLAHKIQILLNDSETRITLGQQAHQFVLENGFTWQMNAKRLIAIYKRAMA